MNGLNKVIPAQKAAWLGWALGTKEAKGLKKDWETKWPKWQNWNVGNQ